jgi:hypothetical protein
MLVLLHHQGVGLQDRGTTCTAATDTTQELQMLPLSPISQTLSDFSLNHVMCCNARYVVCMAYRVSPDAATAVPAADNRLAVDCGRTYLILQHRQTIAHAECAETKR